MPLDPSKIYDTAADLLDSVVTRMTDVYDDYEPAVELPDRQYVHAGEVAFDCEQVVVSGMNLTHAFPGEAGAILVCSPPRHVQLDVWIVRCVPTLSGNGDPPTAAALDASAQIVLKDLWVLAYVLWDGYKAKDWGGDCAAVLLGPVGIVGPEGTHVAVHAQVFLLVT